jgi:hypothetical protein
MVVAALDFVAGEDLGAGEKLILVCRLRSRGFLGAILTFLAFESASLWMSLTVSPWVLSCAAPSRPIAALRKRCGLSERAAKPQLLVRNIQDIEKNYYVNEAPRWREIVYLSMTVGPQKDAPARTRTGDPGEAREHVR